MPAIILSLDSVAAARQSRQNTPVPNEPKSPLFPTLRHGDTSTNPPRPLARHKTLRARTNPKLLCFQYAASNALPHPPNMPGSDLPPVLVIQPN
jgi:hypothetical protein